MTRRTTIAAFSFALAAAAANETQRGTVNHDPEVVARSFAAFAEVNVRWDQDYVYVEADSMPRHQMMVGIRSWNRQVPIPQPYFGSNAFRLPLRPRFATSTVSGKESLFRGAIAVAANGVPIFNPIKQDGRTDTNLAGELDIFGGHAGRADDYHYHLAPVHLADQIGSGLPVAWALDGFPIFAYSEADGSEARNLDWLNGHSHAGSAYHYHATRQYPYLNGGFRGEVALRNGEVAVQPRARRVRPFTRPLRGAEITGFERRGQNSFRLEFELRGEEHSVGYTILPDGGAKFVFTDGSGQSRSEVYRGGRSPLEGRARERDRNRRQRGDIRRRD